MPRLPRDPRPGGQRPRAVIGPRQRGVHLASKSLLGHRARGLRLEAWGVDFRPGATMRGMSLRLKTGLPIGLVAVTTALIAAQAPTTRLTAGPGRFLLDGKPIQIISG